VSENDKLRNNLSRMNNDLSKDKEVSRLFSNFYRLKINKNQRVSYTIVSIKI
jgi:hypothetical protein